MNKSVLTLPTSVLTLHTGFVSSLPRFRDQILQEVLESAYGMMRSAYIASMSSLLANASTWQQYEAALYGFRAVSVMVKTRFLNRVGGEPTVSYVMVGAVRDSFIILMRSAGG